MFRVVCRGSVLAYLGIATFQHHGPKLRNLATRNLTIVTSKVEISQQLKGALYYLFYSIEILGR